MRCHAFLISQTDRPLQSLIVPPAQILAPVLWDVETAVQEALCCEPGPGGGGVRPTAFFCPAC